jgi:hypothetical protein
LGKQEMPVTLWKEEKKEQMTEKSMRERNDTDKATRVCKKATQQKTKKPKNKVGDRNVRRK